MMVLLFLIGLIAWYFAWLLTGISCYSYWQMIWLWFLWYHRCPSTYECHGLIETCDPDKSGVISSYVASIGYINDEVTFSGHRFVKD